MLNHCEIMGRLTASPELRSTQSGKSVLSFIVAVDRNVKEADGERKTDFIQVVAWEKTAEHISRYFTKGTSIIIEGSIQTRTWETADGYKRWATEICAERVHFAGGSKSEAQERHNTDEDPLNNIEEFEGDDIPF